MVNRSDETQRARPSSRSGQVKRATVRLPSPSEEGLETRLALLTCAFAKGREAEFLSGLTAAKRTAAIQLAEETGRLSSSARAARIAQTFQERPEAVERARRLMAESAPELAQAVLVELPPYLRPDGHRLARPGPGPSPMKRFAARLVQEAIR